MKPLTMYVVRDMQSERYVKLSGKGDSWRDLAWIECFAEARAMTKVRADLVATRFTRDGSVPGAVVTELVEPERVDFMHAGFPCFVRRDSELGFYCGYVRIPEGHPCHGMSKERLDIGVAVHGGVTYAATATDKIRSVYWRSFSEATYYIGFDCAHAFDLWAGRDKGVYDEARVEYRTFEWVKAETKRLAEQLRKLAP